MNRFSILAFAVVLFPAVVGAYAESPWLLSDSYGDLQVVVSDSTSDSEKLAAQEFKKYWKLTTGCDISVSAEPGDGITVWIGRDGVPDSLLSKLELDGLGTDGLCIRTVGPDEGPANAQLLIVGGRERGTLYGVYEFFEKYMGVRWLAPDVTHIPQAPRSLPEIDYRYVPPFELRDTSYYHWLGADREKDAMYDGINRINPGPTSFMAHSLHRQIPPDTYFKEHPEYYSFYNGKRHAPVGVPWYLGPGDMPPDMMTQLCFTNPDVVRLLYEAIDKDIKNNPSKKIVHISQMDWFAYCECDACAAIDEYEESHAGSMLTALNEIADRLAEEHPEYRLETIAYQYTRKPPKHLRPRDNIIIKLCSIECDFGRPLDDPNSTRNKAFVEDIVAWSKIAKRLHVWDYTPNYSHAQFPHPNFHVLQPNMQFYLKHKVKGMFEQGSELKDGEFQELRAYMIHKLLWNPFADAEAIKNEFIELYYGDAAPYIKAYIDVLTKQLKDSGEPLPCFNNVDWMGYDAIVKAEELFKKAFAAVQSEEIRQRVDEAYLPVQCAALICPPRITTRDAAFVLERPPSLTYEQYIERAKHFGMTPHPEWRGPFRLLSQMLDGRTPPRYETVPIEALENEFYEVWVLPKRGGAVVRFYDKRSGMDLFRGEDALRKGRWQWQEWDVMNPDDPAIEIPVGSDYSLADRTENSMVVETKLENGLAIRREMTLKPGSDKLEVALAFRNESDVPLVPRVKSHPEFWTQGSLKPEIWVEKNGEWYHRPLKFVEPDVAGVDHIEPAGITRWALSVPDRKLTVVIGVDADEIENLFYYFNLPNEQVNLEMVPNLSPLSPGDARTVQATYAISREEPKKL
jgi:hypothetical protein